MPSILSTTVKLKWLFLILAAMFMAQAVLLRVYQPDASPGWLAFFSILGLVFAVLSIATVRGPPPGIGPEWETYQRHLGGIDAPPPPPEQPRIMSMCHMSTNGVLLLYSDGTLWIGALDYRAKDGRMAPYLKLERLS